MPRIIPIGTQSFVKLRQNNCFYIDKTKFIKEWWIARDRVTVITRPRQFGKTLMLDTVRTFFAPEFSGRSDLFEGLEIWNDEQFRTLQGTIPVIFLSFSYVKGSNFNDTVAMLKRIVCGAYSNFAHYLHTNSFSERCETLFAPVHIDMSDLTLKNALRTLSECLFHQYNTKPIILIDEYDIPLRTALANGYWEELVDFMEEFFISTFKTNPYLERGLLTGITRFPTDSLGSGYNNFVFVSTTSNLYTDCFGFTEDEVFAAIDEYGLDDKALAK